MIVRVRATYIPLKYMGYLIITLLIIVVSTRPTRSENEIMAVIFPPRNVSKYVLENI